MSLSSKSSLKIALLGTRGIPARYGGFETFAEELSTRLVARGHEVTVYARHKLGQRRPLDFWHSGVRVRSTATLMHKYLETPLHALTSFVNTIGAGFDVALLCNAANAPFAWILKMQGIPLIINVDGIERERGKWNSLGKAWYVLGERAAAACASAVVADAEVIAQYYREKFSLEPNVITYGAEAKPIPAGGVLAQFGLSPQKYILYVSRLEPENNARGVIEAYLKANLEIPLVIVGDAPYATEYKRGLYELAGSGKGIVFTGFQFGEAYRELRTNCALYVQATEVGGTHPALVEAMAYGNAIVANKVPEHEEVLGDAGLYYAKNNFSELASLFCQLVAAPEQIKALQSKARLRAAECYSWERITDQYEKLFLNLLRRD